MDFSLSASFSPTGDQPATIEKLAKGAKAGNQQTLLGVTGSGKTFTIANVIAKTGKNCLVMSHNKTLAAQLYSEFKEFFPDNRVEYFVSYFDYYQPESYLPTTDTYIEKSSMVNEKIEQMRFSATASLMSKEPTIVVASVSAIYGIGSPKDYEEMSVPIARGMRITRNELIAALTAIQYERNDFAPSPGCVRARGYILDVFPSYSNNYFRIELDGDAIKSITEFDAKANNAIAKRDSAIIFPARHFVVPIGRIKKAVAGIREELKGRLPELGELEGHRLKSRVNYDAEMIENTGFCKGVENYSRYFDGRQPGERPFCLMDFFTNDDLLVIDESHVTIPQLHGMYNGDYSRKKSLIDYGFRLPSAYDNRPLKWEEFEAMLKARPTIFVSATPGEYEKVVSHAIVEQLVRPTGIVDPLVEIRPAIGQVEDLCKEVEAVAAKGMRTLVTTITKRHAEDLTEFMLKRGIKTRYLHSDVDTLDRTDLIRRLRLGEFDCLVGINLLREGLDIPEVGLVAILDADKEGFLRNATSLIQTIGRAARNASSKSIMYAENNTKSMENAIAETSRRRAYQLAYNKRHGITPTSILKRIGREETKDDADEAYPSRRRIVELEAQMQKASESLDFEKAIEIRERLRRLQGVKR